MMMILQSDYISMLKYFCIVSNCHIVGLIILTCNMGNILKHSKCYCKPLHLVHDFRHKHYVYLPGCATMLTGAHCTVIPFPSGPLHIPVHRDQGLPGSVHNL